jgi:two-component system, OmpR family, heavy metal sensor histidine kinase CusS
MKKLSIGLRLTLWYLAIFAAAQVAFGAGMYFILRQNMYGEIDSALRGQVDDLVEMLRVQKKTATVAKIQEEVAEQYLLEHSGDYLQIYASDGTCIFQSDFLERHTLVTAAPDGLSGLRYEDVQLGGLNLRFVTQRIEANGHTYAVQTGVSTERVVTTLRLFRKYLLMFAPLLLLAAASGGYWLSRRALAPVDSLTQTARRIGAGNLNERVPELHTGDELQRLADTFNQMLGRIETAFLRISQFTADASHELRTPVSLIRTESEIALRRSRGEAEYRDALRQILLEAERTTGLLDQLLSLARADSGREALDFQCFDFRPAAMEIFAAWARIAAVKNLEFHSEVSDRSLLINGDRSALQRLLTILLDNAIKYTATPGSVFVSLESGPEKLTLTVRDSGIGIAKEEQAKIFERFYRVDKARSRALGGAGLGLAIAQWIVQQHHGTIEVKSVLGQGATFVAVLPLAVGAARISQAETLPVGS